MTHDDVIAEFDLLEQQAKDNMRQWEDNAGVVRQHLASVEAARWRLLRNRKLLRECRALTRANGRLIAANEKIIARRAEIIRAVQWDGS